jgi:sugar phosphate isomerase/epimerase
MRERISIVTDEISQDLLEVRGFLRENDIHAVELRCIAGRRVPDVSASDRGELRAWARAGDPAVLAVSPGTFKCDVEDHVEIRRQLEETLPAAIELARDLDAAFLVTFGFHNPSGKPPDGIALDALREAASACADASLPLLVENEPGFLAGSADETGRLLAAVAHPNLYVNWDPLNGNEFDAPRLEAGLRALFGRVRHVHVKNGNLRPGRLLAECCTLREGAIDWRGHLALLRELKYEGYLGVETHFEPVRENSAVVLAELRAMLSDVKASGTSI